MRPLDDEILSTIVGGFDITTITIANTGKQVHLPSAANNQIVGYNTATNIDPYGASGGRLTAGDGTAVPGIAQ
jgi:hypothetical protein